MIFKILNLDYPELKEVKKLYGEGKIGEAKNELLLYFKNRKTVKGYIGENKLKLKEVILKNYSEEISRIKENSDNFLKGKIVFDMKWDMERCKKPYYFKDKIEWNNIPFGDPEWTYMLNRHKHWLSYGESYFITADKKYEKAFFYELKDWINNNPINETSKKLTWRTIEAGIRCRNWVKALDYFIDSDSFTVEILELLLVSLNNHMEYIKKESGEQRFLSNWVILENHGLFIASKFFPELKNSESNIEFSLNYLKKALEIQILRDGTHWEQSFMYHNEMLNSIMDMIIIAENNNYKLDKDIYEKVKKMAKATESFMEPSFTQGNYGDSDKEDLRDILAVASVILKDEELKYGIEKLPIENLFTLGLKGVSDFNNLISSKKNYNSIANLDSGNYILRNGWGFNSTYSFFKVGALGSGHGHYDLLHFHINHKGEDLIVDSGRYNYAEDNPYRVLLKKAVSHNSFTLDDEEFSVAKGSWGSSSVATVVKRPHSFGKLADFVEGGHLGYIKKGAFVNRKLIYIKEKLWIVSDEIFSANSHNYKAYFNFNKDSISLENSFGKEVVNYKFNGGDFKIIPLDNQNISFEKAYISKEYNEIYESKKAVLESKSEGNSSFNTLLYIDEGDSIEEIKYLDIFDWRGKILDSRYSKALKIKFEKESYIILIVNEEEPTGRKSYIIEGNVIYGKVAIIKESKNNKEIEVLSY